MRSDTHSSGRLKRRKYNDGLILGLNSMFKMADTFVSFSLRIDAAYFKISNIFASFSKFVERFCDGIRVVSEILGKMSV